MVKPLIWQSWFLPKSRKSPRSLVLNQVLRSRKHVCKHADVDDLREGVRAAKPSTTREAAAKLIFFVRTYNGRRTDCVSVGFQ